MSNDNIRRHFLCSVLALPSWHRRGYCFWCGHPFSNLCHNFHHVATTLLRRSSQLVVWPHAQSYTWSFEFMWWCCIYFSLFNPLVFERERVCVCVWERERERLGGGGSWVKLIVINAKGSITKSIVSLTGSSWPLESDFCIKSVLHDYQRVV